MPPVKKIIVGSGIENKIDSYKPLLEAKEWNENVRVAFVEHQFTERFLEELIEKSQIAKYAEFWKTISITQNVSIDFTIKYALRLNSAFEKTYKDQNLNYDIDFMEELEKMHKEMKAEKSKVNQS